MRWTRSVTGRPITRIACAAIALAGLAQAASAQSYLLIPSAPPGTINLGSAGTYAGTPGVMLFSASDGSLVDPQFISAATSSYPVTLTSPIKAIQVGSELWVTDTGNSSQSIQPAIYCFTADYDATLRPHPTFIRSITGGMSTIRGCGLVGTGSAARVWIGNQGTTNGAPGAAILVYRADGTFDSAITWPGSTSIGPFDFAAITIGGNPKMLVTGGGGTNNVYAFNADGTLDTADFANGIFHTGGSDGLNNPSGICVAPSGPGGASEVWIHSQSNGAAPLAVGTYRYSGTGTQVAYYPIDWTIPGFAKGIWWINASGVVYTDPVASSVTSNGSVKKFNPAIPPVNEIQTLSISGATGGTFTLTFNGQTTAPIAYNATGSTVQTALAALNSIGAAIPNIPPNAPLAPNGAWTSGGTARQTNVQIIPGTLALPAQSLPIMFMGGFNGATPSLITADGSGLTPAGSTVTVTRTTPGQGTPTFLYPTSAAPANTTSVVLTGQTSIPVYNPATSATWPNGNAINPQYISAFTPGPSVPTSPYGSGSAVLSPNQAGVLAGTSTLITVTATPGTTPTSTGLAVAADFSALGGSASQAFTNTTGNTFAYTLNVPAAQAGGLYNVLLSVTDGQGRTGGGNVQFTVIARAPANYFAENDPAVPNDTGKAQAQLVTLATASQIATSPPPAAYRGIWGTSTGTSTTSGAGVTTGDNYRLKTLARPLGIYLNSLAMTGGTDAPTGANGHLGVLHGLNQTTSGVGTTDTFLQQYPSNAPTIPPSRTNYWYGFGRAEEIYYRATGGPLSTAEYLCTFDSQQVFPETLPTGSVGYPNLASGSFTFARDSGNNTPMAFWIYDSSLNPIAGSGAQNITTQTITRTLPDGGPYYLAVTPTSISNNLASPADSPSRTTNVTDFPNVLVSGALTNVLTGTLNFTLTDSSSSQFHVVPSLSQYQYFHIYWYQFYVGAQVSPIVTGSASPSPVIASDDPNLIAHGGYSTLISTMVTPGNNPPSTDLGVTANLTAFGGSDVQPLADQSGGLYTYTLRVPASQAPGLYTIQVRATDGQSRSASATLPLLVLPVPGPGFTVETEPNDGLVSANAATIAPGGGVYGFSSGSGVSQTGDPATRDFFLLQTTTAPLGIYRNRVTLTSSGANAVYSPSIRGRQQVNGSVNPFDQFTQFQGGSNGMNQWYSFGKGEQIEYRVDGTVGNTAEYRATFTRTPVTPIAVPATLASGPITISRGAGNSSVPAMWVYDANLNPIDGFGSQGLTPLTRTFAPGTYYLAVSDVATSNNQATPPDSSSLNSPVLGYADEIANNSTSTYSNMKFRLEHAGGSALAIGSKTGAFDIVWYQLTVADNPLAGACCLQTGSCSGSTAATCTGVFQGAGTLCTPELCPQLPPGVCCRGATCIPMTVSSDCTTGGAQAGALFVTSTQVCNSGGVAISPCCYADYNKANGITVQDIFDFLGDWFSGARFASIGGDGVSGALTVQNIFDFLSAWFAGGC